MSIFRRKKKMPELENDYRKDPLWYVKKLYKENFRSEGNWGVICEQGGDGLVNVIELLSFMESKGWIFVNHDTVLFPTGMLTDYVFRKADAI